MTNHCLSEKELNLLKTLITSKLFGFKSQIKDSWNRIFGNILLVTDKGEIEIRNELTEINYLGCTEDVSKFYIKRITDHYPFHLMVDDTVFETPVNEILADIIIVKDEISVTDLQRKSIYKIAIDTAIILKTENSCYVISREWSLEEELIFVKTADYKKSVYSVENIIKDWSNEEENLDASCKRKYLSLKDI